MSLLTPERVPVKVYKWDDADAPALDKSAGCVATIFKACLVTGYGTKDGAGWTMPWEDTAAGVKVLRPEVGPHTDFYLRLSADTGSQVDVVVYQTMTGIDNGSSPLFQPVPFIYSKASADQEWVVVASPHGFWFVCKTTNGGGTWFWVNSLSSDSETGGVVGLHYSGGTWQDGDSAWGLIGATTDAAGYSLARAMLANTASEPTMFSFAKGDTPVGSFSINDYAPVYLNVDKMRAVTGFLLSLNPSTLPIFSPVFIGDGRTAIAIKLNNYGDMGSAAIPTDFWLY